MTLVILGVGRLRERFYRDAADEYVKRLRRFGAVEEIELPDLPEPANTSPAIEQKIREKEGEAILSRIRPTDHVVALCIEGKQLSSEQLAERVSELEGRGVGRAVFVIGGSLGLSEAVIRRANERLSFSRMTFPHQLARVMLLEQLYRARKISANERYHK